MTAFAQPITDTADNDQNSAAAASGTASSFPLARVKKIMKADKDVNLVSAEAVHLTSIASVQGKGTTVLYTLSVLFFPCS